MSAAKTTAQTLNMIPSGPLSVDVEYKAQPSLPLQKSLSPEGAVGADILPPTYAPEQNNTWKSLYNAQNDMLTGRVCDEYIAG